MSSICESFAHVIQRPRVGQFLCYGTIYYLLHTLCYGTIY